MRYIVLCLCMLAWLLASCRPEKKEGETAGEPVHVSVVRLDKLLDDYVEFNNFSSLQRMNTEYTMQTKLLIEDIIGLGEVADDHIYTQLKDYFSDPVLLRLLQDALVVFEDMTPYEKRFDQAFGYLRRHVPSLPIPQVYAQFSALNESVVVTDTLVGFSVDKYLGADYPLYYQYYYDYQRRSMRPERIVPDCLVFYLMSRYPFPLDGYRTFLDLMLHYGKIHYVVAKALGRSSTAEQLDYTEAEYQWCKANRKNVWDYMWQHGHLHSTDPMLIRKYNKPAPSTAFFGERAPALVGIWMGTQVVESYMKHHRDVTIAQLLEMTDYRALLEASDFKP